MTTPSAEARTRLGWGGGAAAGGRTAEMENDRNADGCPRYRIDDQGGDTRRRSDDPRSGRRWRPLCGDRDLGVVPRQIPRPAAPDRLSIAAGPDGRRAARAGAADRGAWRTRGTPRRLG